jgi:hypothetical protein
VSQSAEPTEAGHEAELSHDLCQFCGSHDDDIICVLSLKDSNSSLKNFTLKFTVIIG